jgi:hypothetical protein
MFSSSANKIREKRLMPSPYVSSSPTARMGHTITDDNVLFLAGQLRQAESWKQQERKQPRRTEKRG